MADKQKQLEAVINDSGELVFTESRLVRDQHVFRDRVLDKVKIVPKLGDNVEITIEMAGHYYEVPPNTIKTILSRNRDEFNLYGEIRVLKGKALKDFKTEFQDETAFKGVNSLTLISRRGLLRLGMLLTESEVAQAIRNYLLNVEETSTNEQREWAVEREISKRERRKLTDAIQYYEGKSMKGHEYSNFTNLVYKILFDCNATQLRAIYDIDRTTDLRDALTTEDLRKVAEVEQVVSGFIKVGMHYEEIKERMLSRKDKFQ